MIASFYVEYTCDCRLVPYMLYHLPFNVTIVDQYGDTFVINASCDMDELIKQMQRLIEIADNYNHLYYCYMTLNEGYKPTDINNI